MSKKHALESYTLGGSSNDALPLELMRVPVLTQNISTAGTAYMIPNHSPQLAFRMFDGNVTTTAPIIDSNSAVPYPHIYGFQFPEHLLLELFKFSYYVPSANHPYLPKDCILQSSSNGTTFTDLLSFRIDNSRAGWVEIGMPRFNRTDYDFRLKVLNGYYTPYNWSAMYEMQFDVINRK